MKIKSLIGDSEPRGDLGSPEAFATRSEPNTKAGEAPADRAVRPGNRAGRVAVAARARSSPGPRHRQAPWSWALRETKPRALWSACRA